MNHLPCADCRQEPMESAQLGVCASCFAKRTKSCCDALPWDASVDYCVGYLRGYLYTLTIAGGEFSTRDEEWRRGYVDGQGARASRAA